MKQFALLAAIAAFTPLVFAHGPSHGHFTASNGSHFINEHGEAIRHFGCGAHISNASPHFLKTVKQLHQDHKNSHVGTRAPRKHIATHRQNVGISIPTYFHIIQSTAHVGTITQDMATAQLTAMNTAYNPYGISFTMAGTDFTTNDAWAVAAGTDMDAAKAALRQGTYNTLNIYFHTDFSGGNLGTCTLPSQVPVGADPSVYVSDGCNVNANTMPGGTFLGYNSGMTAVHETGHWLGLLHTFEGYACDGNGDFIDDTPMQSTSTDGCPAKPPKDSCPTVTGVDPIHNYMDYSTDACYEGFTPLQVSRMQQMWAQYRAPAAAAAAGGAS